LTAISSTGPPSVINFSVRHGKCAMRILTDLEQQSPWPVKPLDGFGVMVPLLIQTGQLQPINGRGVTDRLFGDRWQLGH
jgi:hypothetical protein